MLMEWLEPTIVKRVQDVSSDNCGDKKVCEYLDKFVDHMEALQPLVSEEAYLKVVMDMESLLSQICFLCEDLSYRQGMSDGMKLHQDMQKLLDKEILQ